MPRALPVLIASTFLLGGAALAQDGYYATKSDEKAGRLSPGPVPGSGSRAPEVGGENCATATGIGSLPYSDSDDTTGHVNDVNMIPAGCSDYTQVAGPDLIYVFSTGPNNNIAFNVNPTNNIYDPAIYILGTCGTSATCVVGAAGAATGPIVPFKENTHNVSPRGKSSWKLPPDATATYCCPLTW